MKRNTEHKQQSKHNMHSNRTIKKLSLELDKLKTQIADIENAFFNLSEAPSARSSNHYLDKELSDITVGVVSWLERHDPEKILQTYALAHGLREDADYPVSYIYLLSNANNLTVPEGDIVHRYYIKRSESKSELLFFDEKNCTEYNEIDNHQCINKIAKRIQKDLVDIIVEYEENYSFIIEDEINLAKH
jgi:hypothetical protein